MGVKPGIIIYSKWNPHLPAFGYLRLVKKETCPRQWAKKLAKGVVQ